MNALWESFNDVAEGFGLSQDEMAEICRALQPSLEVHARADMDQLSAALFSALDTDEVRPNASRQRCLFVALTSFSSLRTDWSTRSSSSAPWPSCRP